MTATVRTTVTIQKSVFAQAEILAQQLNVSKSQLFELSVENFINNYQRQALSDQIKKADPYNQVAKQVAHRLINRGDIYWVQLEKADIAHPYVVIQENALTRSRLDTLVVCALTSNLKQAKAPGNVLLEPGEASLPKQSVVVVSKISMVYKSQLGECIGSLSDERIHQILAGMRFLQLMTGRGETGEEKY